MRLLFKISETLRSLNVRLYSKWVGCLTGIRKVCFHPRTGLLYGMQYFHIGHGTAFGRGAVLTAWDKYRDESFCPCVEIGEGCNFGEFLHLSCIGNIVIGRNVLTGRWVTINDNSHGETDITSLSVAPLERPLVSKGAIEIGENVWIGDKVTILGGVKIGAGSVIGANSVVTHDIPPMSVAAGIPVRLIKQSR